jgi:hypothetical protein
MGIFSRKYKRSGKDTKRSKDLVQFDEVGVIRTMRDGRQESIRWEELQEVRIITTDEGPFVDDVYWLLIGGGTGCAVPSESEGAQELLQRFQKLPGFNNDVVILAMGCAENAQYVCWKRNNEP